MYDEQIRAIVGNVPELLREMRCSPELIAKVVAMEIFKHQYLTKLDLTKLFPPEPSP